MKCYIYIEERVIELARHILETNATVHKDVTERLLEISPAMALGVKNVLGNNKAERHIRGGLATQQKYKGV